MSDKQYFVVVERLRDGSGAVRYDGWDEKRANLIAESIQAQGGEVVVLQLEDEIDFDTYDEEEEEEE